MLKNKKNIIAISTFTLATLLSPAAHATPALGATLGSYSTVAQTLVLSLSPMTASFGQILSERFTASWNSAERLLKSQNDGGQIATASLESSLTTSAVTARPKAGAVQSPRQPSEDVFGSVAIPFKKLGALKKAAPTFAEIAKGTALRCGKEDCLDLEAVVQKTAAGGGMSSLRDKLNLVNHQVNQRIAYRKDIDIHGRLDRWTSPSETLALGVGDCEDYALLKMAVLASQGVSLSDMTVVILYDRKRHFYHAVLSVEVKGTHYILDNMRDKVLADSQLPDYQPLFSISNGRGFLHGTRTKGKALAMTSFDNIAPGEGGEL